MPLLMVSCFSLECFLAVCNSLSLVALKNFRHNLLHKKGFSFRRKEKPCRKLCSLSQVRLARLGMTGVVPSIILSQCMDLPQKMAAGDDGMNFPPTLHYTDRKGGTLQIMQQQFKRAIGVTIVQGNAKQKFGHLHYVCKSAKETTNASRVHHSDNKWKPIQNGHASWYNMHTPEGYSTYQQVRNGFYFGML